MLIKHTSFAKLRYIFCFCKNIWLLSCINPGEIHRNAGVYYETLLNLWVYQMLLLDIAKLVQFFQ